MIQFRTFRFYALIVLLPFFLPVYTFAAVERPTFWHVQSIDTMKYSRDIAREKSKDLSFDVVIEKQIEQIVNIGATHVAIATPYDEEFLPFLKRWVTAVRRHGLKVWYRGNWSGWEGWFNYPIITRADHLNKTKSFILANSDLFQDGDIFSACPECENGGPTGDPRFNGDVKGHRKFLIDEHLAMSDAFKKIGKVVTYNFNSMNGDVARLIMDQKTTEALGGIVTIDHYARTPEKLALDIKEIHEQSGGLIVLGEIGVPIPDIHGRLTDEEQNKWLMDALRKVAAIPEVIGINYWVNYGGSTNLWRDNGNSKPIAETLKLFYTPKTLSGYIIDSFNKPINYARIKSEYTESISQINGYFEIPYLSFETSLNLNISAVGFVKKYIITKVPNAELEIQLDRNKESLWFSFFRIYNNYFLILQFLFILISYVACRSPKIPHLTYFWQYGIIQQ